MASSAVRAGRAFLTDVAARARVGAAAIDIRFNAVLAMIQALVGDAQQGISIASVRHAIGVIHTFEAGGAGQARGAAAIDIRFTPVLAMIRALAGDAQQGIAIASLGGAIRVRQAFKAGGAGGARAAAVDISFSAVLALIYAQ